MRVQIDWGLPSQADKQTAPHALPLNPTLKEKRVAMTSWLQNDTVAAGLASHIDYAMTQLSLLEVLPGVPNGDGQPWAPPLVLTVRSYVPTGYGGGLQSTVDIWEILSDQPQQLHQAFQQLSSRNGLGSNPQPATRLRKLESIVFQKVVVSINLLHSGRVVCFAFSDGSIQHRDRVTMTEIHTSPDLDRIVTLNQMGFHYAEESPCLQVAFSPSSCSFVQICENGKIKWNHLKFPAGDIGSTPQDVQYSAVIAGLTVALSTAVASMANFDDILILARQFNSKPRFAIDWIGQIVRLLRVHVDYSEGLSQDALVRNTNLQVCLSIMNHMGFGGEFRPRSFGGKFSLITLHVRNLVILITLANNANSQRKVTPLDEPEVVEVLASSFKWTVDLLTWISDCIFELEDDVKFMTLLNASPGSQTDWKDLFSYLQSKEDVVLHLLLCSSSRGFLISVCRRLLHLDGLGKKAVQYYQQQFAKGAPSLQGSADSYENHTRLFSAYQKMYAHASNSMIDIAQLEKLLSGLGSQITTVYEQSFRIQAQRALQQPQQGTNANRQQQQQQTDARVKALQNQNELMLLLGGTPFAVLQPMLKKFFETDLQAFKATVPDRAKLYFADYSSLGILDDRHSLKERRKNRGRYVDTFSHVEMRPDAPQPKGQQESTASPSQWRRCVRCTSVMEDTTADPKTGLAIVMVNTNQRRCCCGANWSVVPRGNTVV
ncbi:hypothetical protein MCOR25_011226 [Pyricularia grisea]|nr:hypothetical protein MCOR25_011226 [Pyricularia grisea]